MSEKKRKIILALVLVVIVASIWYLGSLNAGRPSGNVQNPQVVELSPSTIGDDNVTTATSSTSTTQSAPRVLKNTVKNLPRAKELVSPAGFINTNPFALQDLVGKKVILLDFWTYSCINCIRTLPYLKAWNEKYKDKGLVIVGIHTPEFEFEKEKSNVLAATEKYGITYPVVLDNNYGTWSAYGNLYWPREYLIDINGYIAHDHIGEGGYDETETEIQKLLKERADALGIPLDIAGGMATPTSTIAVNAAAVGSPETYFGAERNSLLAGGRWGVNGVQTFAEPGTVTINKLYLTGAWNFEDQFAENKTSGAKILYYYNAKDVYFVAGAPNGATIKILRDGKPLGTVRGGDVILKNGVDTATIKENKLYRLIEDSSYGEHTLEIEVENGTLQAFTFTFG